MRCNTIRVQSTLRGLRLEEARHQVLRRQEAIEGKVQLPVQDCLRGLSERIPRRRRGRLGRDQRGQDQDLSGGVSASREE